MDDKDWLNGYRPSSKLERFLLAVQTPMWWRLYLLYVAIGCFFTALPISFNLTPLPTIACWPFLIVGWVCVGAAHILRRWP